ncbi:hypothetical protein TNCV_4663841 [Trichonephila clavipes]|uniref:Uncharacterized protein n=1 Tax=Trichonephila clavipes TaxID=2585209 RepID=A0A8X6S976_TRICX|nr:hypothetical protein TNCV_4663841 [Trichonephila clavipes]
MKTAKHLLFDCNNSHYKSELTHSATDCEQKTYDTANLADVKTEKCDTMKLDDSSVIRQKEEMLKKNEMDRFNPDNNTLNEDEEMLLPPLQLHHIFFIQYLKRIQRFLPGCFQQKTR